MTSLFKDKSAERAAQKQRELQKIANDRQLAAERTADQETTVSRKNPRGRRLFSDSQSAGGLPSKLT